MDTDNLDAENSNRLQADQNRQVRRIESTVSNTHLQDANMSADNITITGDHARIDTLNLHTPHKTEAEFKKIMLEIITETRLHKKLSTENQDESKETSTHISSREKEYIEFVKTILPVATLCGGFIVTVIKDETCSRCPSLLMGAMLAAVIYFDKPPSTKITKAIEDELCANSKKLAKVSKCVIYLCTAIHAESSLQKGFALFTTEFMARLDNNDKNELDNLNFWGCTFLTDPERSADLIMSQIDEIAKLRIQNQELNKRLAEHNLAEMNLRISKKMTNYSTSRDNIRLQEKTIGQLRHRLVPSIKSRIQSERVR